MRVGICETGYSLYDELVRRLKNHLENYLLLDWPYNDRKSPRRHTNQTRTTSIFGPHKFIVSSLERHLLFTTSEAAIEGISTVNEPGNPQLKKVDVVVPLKQMAK